MLAAVLLRRVRTPYRVTSSAATGGRIRRRKRYLTPEEQESLRRALELFHRPQISPATAPQELPAAPVPAPVPLYQPPVPERSEQSLGSQGLQELPGVVHYTHEALEFKTTLDLRNLSPVHRHMLLVLFEYL